MEQTLAGPVVASFTLRLCPYQESLLARAALEERVAAMTGQLSSLEAHGCAILWPSLRPWSFAWFCVELPQATLKGLEDGDSDLASLGSQ